MLDSMRAQATIIQEGEVAQKDYAEFAEWCEDRASNLGFEVKTGYVRGIY